MDRITLLAMAPSGETYLARDRAERVWLFQPIGAGEPEIVDPSLVGRAVAHGGFDRVDRDFESWDDLDRFLNDRASLVVQEFVRDPSELDSHDVARLLAVARSWMDDGHHRRATQTALALLSLPAARADVAVHDRLVALLVELGQPSPRWRSEPKTDAQRAVRERWDSLAA